VYVVTLYDSRSLDSLDWDVYSTSASTSSSRRVVSTLTYLINYLVITVAQLTGGGRKGQLQQATGAQDSLTRNIFD